LGRILHGEKNYERAVAEYLEALRLDPYEGGWSEKESLAPSGFGGRHDVVKKGEHSNAYRTQIALADALVAWGKRDEALTMLKEARAAQPAELNIALKLGSVLEGAGQKDEARKIYLEILELSPDNRIVKMRLAVLDGKDPKTVFTDPNVEKNKDAFKALNQEIRDLRDQLKYHEALAKIREGLETFPDNTSLLHQQWTLLCHLDKENQEETKAIEEKLIKLGQGARLQIRPPVLVDKDGKPIGKVRTPEERAAGTAKAAVRQEIMKLRTAGKNEEALVKIREAQRQYPDDRALLADEYGALQQMGRMEEAKQVMAKMTARPVVGKEPVKEAKPPREKGRRPAGEAPPPMFHTTDDDEF
jgi:Flp pilus assembly protein TadD